MKHRMTHWLALLAGISSVAAAAGPALAASGHGAPLCQIGSGPVLPAAYLKLAQRDPSFKWIAKVKPGAREVQGSGWERVDGSEMRDDFSFLRVDLNGDGICDWYLTSSSPQSSGGDRSSFNTFYLWRSGGWKRLGAEVPAGKPDVLGLGRTDAQRAEWLFGEQLAIALDTGSGQTWFISWHENRNEARSMAPGYQLSLWDTHRQSLVVQDKWKSGSAAGKVYAAFKANGARSASHESQTMDFDPAVEAYERQALCQQRSLGLSAETGRVSLTPPPDLQCTP